MILVLLDRYFAVDSDLILILTLRNFTKLTVLGDIWIFVMYCMYGVSVPFLLIESTDSMIVVHPLWMVSRSDLTQFSFQ